jgi:hypothetical protein
LVYLCGMKQTAVNYLESEIKKLKIPVDSATQVSMIRIIEQALQMEKQHTLSAQMDMFHFINNLEYGLEYLEKRDKAEEFAEQYYKQTYKNKK